MTTAEQTTILPEQITREWLLAERQATLIRLGAIERALGMDRTRLPKHQQRHAPAQPERSSDAKSDR